MSTKTHAKSPPAKPPYTTSTAIGYGDDHIRELGDKIACLSPRDRKELTDFLKTEYRIRL